MFTRKAALKGDELTLTKIVEATSSLSDKPHTLSGTTYTRAELLAKVVSVLSVKQKVRDLRLALTTAIDASRGQRKAEKSFLRGFRAMLETEFGVESVKLETFGFKLRKKLSPMSSEQKLARAAKARATRAARHTLGSRQKQAIRATGEPRITITMPPEAPATTGDNGSPHGVVA